MKEKIRCLIIEDNRVSIELLESHLRELPFIEITGICFSAADAIDFLRDHRIDLIITDIEMAGMDGMTLIRSLEHQYPFIVVSNYPNYALDGFELGLIDYLKKPVTQDRLLKALNRYIEYAKLKALNNRLLTEDEHRILSSVHIGEKARSEYFIIRVNRQMIKIDYESIIYLTSKNDYLQVVTPTKNYLTNKTLEKALNEVADRGFYQIHKSYVVNRRYISSITRYTLTLTSGEEIPIGKSFYNGIRDLLKNRKI